MIRNIQIILLGLLITLTGCASPEYFSHRKNDAADIFTATIGIGGGAKLRVGPINPGLLYNIDFAGIKSGKIFTGSKLDNGEIFELTTPLPFMSIPQSGGSGMHSIEVCGSVQPEFNLRDKNYIAVGVVIPV